MRTWEKRFLVLLRDLCPVTCGEQKISERNHIIIIFISRPVPDVFPGPAAVAVNMSYVKLG